MAVRQPRKTDNGSDSGIKNRSYKWQILLIIVTALFSGGVTTGGLQFFSPTNVHLQTDVEDLKDNQDLFKQDYENYKDTHAIYIELKDKNLDLRLSIIQEDIKEIKEILKNGN